MKKELTRAELREKKIRQNRIRRQRQLRRRIVFTLAITILLICSTLGFTSITSKAQEAHEEVNVKCFTSVMVPYGSSLYELAEEYSDSRFYDSYQDYIDEVKYINHIDDDIKAGSYLVIPYYETL